MKSVEIMVKNQKKTITTRDTLRYIQSLLTQEQIDIAIKKAQRDRREKAIHDPLLIAFYVVRENLPFSEESKIVRMIVEGLLYQTEIAYTDLLQEPL